MSTPPSGRNKPPRKRFAPDVLRGEPADRAAEQFAQEAEAFGLVWTCRDCALVLPDGRCSVGWPNPHLQWQGSEPPLVLVGTEPAFCKAFEPLWS